MFPWLQEAMCSLCFHGHKRLHILSVVWLDFNVVIAAEEDGHWPATRDPRHFAQERAQCNDGFLRGSCGLWGRCCSRPAVPRACCTAQDEAGWKACSFNYWGWASWKWDLSIDFFYFPFNYEEKSLHAAESFTWGWMLSDWLWTLQEKAAHTCTTHAPQSPGKIVLDSWIKLINSSGFLN